MYLLTYLLAVLSYLWRPSFSNHCSWKGLPQPSNLQSLPVLCSCLKMHLFRHRFWWFPCPPLCSRSNVITNILIILVTKLFTYLQTAAPTLYHTDTANSQLTDMSIFTTFDLHEPSTSNYLSYINYTLMTWTPRIFPHLLWYLWFIFLFRSFSVLFVLISVEDVALCLSSLALSI